MSILIFHDCIPKKGMPNLHPLRFIHEAAVTEFLNQLAANNDLNQDQREDRLHPVVGFNHDGVQVLRMNRNALQRTSELYNIHTLRSWLGNPKSWPCRQVYTAHGILQLKDKVQFALSWAPGCLLFGREEGKLCMICGFNSPLVCMGYIDLPLTRLFQNHCGVLLRTQPGKWTQRARSRSIHFSSQRMTCLS